ncbi:MAG: AraC family transcriptional regulator [Bacteroidetes bacterium]|nr:AraC family transcriptional regulator [Bacteroidota bacterium]
MKHPEFAFYINNTASLIAPVLYLYVRTLAYKITKLKWSDLIHLLMYTVLVVWSFFDYHLLPSNEQLTILTTGVGLNELLMKIIVAMMFSQFLIYLILTIRLIIRYRKLVRENYSEDSKVNSSWLSQIVVVFLIIALLAVIENVIESNFSSETYENTLLIIFFGYLVFINWIIFKALKVPQLFQGIDKDVELAKEMDQGTLTEADKRILNKLNEYMLNEKPYLNSTLTLRQLAKNIELSSRELSILINNHLNQNFFDYVNTFRIENTKQKLIDFAYKDHTVLELMYDSGFNSKSSFNTAFRKVTGLVPTAYRHKYLITK